MERHADKWNSLPKGWTQDSLKKFWSSLTGDKKHKVTACIKKMEGKIDNPGAFCASLNDKIDPGWRSRKKKASMPSKLRMWDGEIRPVDRKAWVWIEKTARENKKWAETHKYAENPDEWPASGMSIDMLKERLNKSVEEMATESYIYFWWRSHLNGNSGNPIDLAARRDWEKATRSKILPEEIVNMGDAKKSDPDKKRKWKNANSLAAQWIMKQAAAGPFDLYVPLVKQMVGAIFLYLLKYQQQDPTADKAPYAKAFVSGFIVAMFGDLKPRDTQLVNSTFKLLEQIGPVEHGEMLNTHSLSKKYASLIRKTGGAIIAATIAVELLKKSRQTGAASKLERLLAKLLASELSVGVPGKKKKETEAQVLKRMVQAEMASARGLYMVAKKDPSTVRAYTADILEDANWHKLAGDLWDEPTYEIDHSVVSSIANRHDWDVMTLAIHGIAAFSLTKDRAGIKTIKDTIKRNYPDYLKDQAKSI